MVILNFSAMVFFLTWISLGTVYSGESYILQENTIIGILLKLFLYGPIAGIVVAVLIIPNLIKDKTIYRLLTKKLF